MSLHDGQELLYIRKVYGEIDASKKKSGHCWEKELKVAHRNWKGITGGIIQALLYITI